MCNDDEFLPSDDVERYLDKMESRRFERLGPLFSEFGNYLYGPHEGEAPMCDADIDPETGLYILDSGGERDDDDEA